MFEADSIKQRLTNTQTVCSKEIGLLVELLLNLVLCAFLMCLNIVLNIPVLPHSFIQVFCLFYYLTFHTACYNLM